MLTKCADPNELETAASAEIPANPSTVLWVSIRFDQAYEAVMVGVTAVSAISRSTYFSRQYAIYTLQLLVC